MQIDYKQKYLSLKAEFIAATDLSYRLGMQKGLEQGQQQAQAQQLADMQAKEAAMNGQIDPATGQPIDPNAQGGAPGQPMPGQDPAGDPNLMAQDGMDDGSNGEELDSHIAELEGLVAKGEKPSIPELRKKLTELKDLRKAQKNKVTNGTKAVNTQKKFINNILAKWEQDVNEVKSDISQVVQEAEKLTKK